MLSQEEFIVALADRFVERAKMTQNEALDYAEIIFMGYLDDNRIAFGDPDYDWSLTAAFDIADEDMSYWEN